MKKIYINGDFVPHILKAIEELKIPFDKMDIKFAKPGVYELSFKQITDNELFQLGVITNANYYKFSLDFMLSKMKK